MAAKLDQVPLPSWPHARDTLTVWKRHSFCAIQYDDSEEEESGGEDEEEVATRKNGIDGDEDNGAGSSPDGDHGAFASAKSSGGAVAGRAGGGVEGGGEDGSADCDGDGSLAFGSDDDGSMEGLPIGVPDVDMYAFVPEPEQMPSAMAAPCVRFLLDA